MPNTTSPRALHAAPPIDPVVVDLEAARYRALIDPTPALLGAMMDEPCSLAAVRQVAPYLDPSDPESPWDAVILRHIIVCARDGAKPGPQLIDHSMRASGEYGKPGAETLTHRLAAALTHRDRTPARIGPLCVAMVHASLTRRYITYGEALAEAAQKMSDEDRRRVFDEGHATLVAHETRLAQLREKAQTV
ncbi:hypothetical protein [Rhodococcus ruber]|uniref:hypothetical protein n=1 Tax=Rhodococcus ruber TaxID=1830 RepID=UPI003D81B540